MGAEKDQIQCQWLGPLNPNPILDENVGGRIEVESH